MGAGDRKRQLWSPADAASDYLWQAFSMTSALPDQSTSLPDAPGSYVEPDHPRWLLAACCIAGASVFIVPPVWTFHPPDAAPFGAGWTTMRFLTSIGGIVTVLMLIVGGLLGDYFGRRRFLLIGLTLSVVAHGLLLFADTNVSHIVLRIAAQLSGALILPLALAPLYIFYRGKARVRAFAWYAFATSAATILASYFGQLFLNLFDWHMTYLLPGLLSAIALVLVFITLPESYISSHGTPKAIAYAGGSLLILALIGGVVQVGLMPGWVGPVAIVAALAAAIGLALLLWWEIRTPGSWLVDYRRKVWDMVMLITIGVLVQLVFNGVFQPTFRYLSVVKDFDLWLRVLAIAPLFVGMFIAIRLVGRIWRSDSVRRVLTYGLLLTGISTALLALRPAAMPYWAQVLPLIAFGFAIQATKTVWANAFFQTVIDDFVGLNAGIQGATMQIGGTLGSLLGGQLVVLFGYRAFEARLSPFVANEAIRELYETFTQSFSREIALATADLQSLGAVAWDQYVAAYATAFGQTLMVMVAICFGSALLIHFLLRPDVKFTAQPVAVDTSASTFEELAWDDLDDIRATLQAAEFSLDPSQSRRNKPAE